MSHGCDARRRQTYALYAASLHARDVDSLEDDAVPNCLLAH
jgi:hypothetical protein